jgi:hypothetical protein
MFALNVNREAQLISAATSLINAVNIDALHKIR